MRSLFNQIVQWLFFGNWFIAICASAATWQSFVLLHVSIGWLQVGFSGVATLFVYTIDRVVAWESMKPLLGSRHRWLVAHNKQLIVVCMASVAVLAILSIKLSLAEWLLLGHLGILSVCYSVPLLGSKGGGRKPLRSLPGVKIFLIAYVWAVATVGLPVLASGQNMFGGRSLLLMAERGLFIFALTLPFDVRDAEGDKAIGVRTLPHMLGVGGVKVLMVGCYAACMLCALLAYGSLHLVVAHWLSCGLACGLAFAGWRVQNDMHYSATMDGMILGQAALVGLLVFAA
jgi:4-hydroxybenzoate polyprenyltransferase